MFRPTLTASILLLGHSLIAFPASGQEPRTALPAGETPPSLQIQILDEPKAIDPAAFLPAEVTAKFTVEFKETPFKEVVKWLSSEARLNVVVDGSALDLNPLLSTEPVTDWLRDEPLYQFLDRLRLKELGWSFQEGVLVIGSFESLEESRATVSYNLGGLFDAGFRSQPLLDAIQQETSGPWDADEPGTGTLILLGDVLFVRQTQRVQREVAALLAGLARHGRRTMLLDPPQHVRLAEKLRQRVSVRLQNVTFRQAVAEIAKQLEVEIRLDESSLQDAGISLDHDPIFQTLTDRTLATILGGLSESTPLTTDLEDGALWVTTAQHAAERRRTAIFDVRDLCRDANEGSALMDAIQSQTAGPWDVNEPGTGTMSFFESGVLVVRQTRQQLDGILQLLENYRTALKASKPRPPDAGENDLETRYYRLPSAVADDLVKLIPGMIAPDSWQAAAAGQPGTIAKSASFSNNEVVNGPVTTAEGSPGKPATAPVAGVVVTPYSVLIIRQTKKNHRAIAEMLWKVEHGDASSLPGHGYPAGMGGMGGGGFGGGGGGFGGAGGGTGGFGGGFFQVPGTASPARALRVAPPPESPRDESHRSR